MTTNATEADDKVTEPVQLDEPEPTNGGTGNGEGGEQVPSLLTVVWSKGMWFAAISAVVLVGIYAAGLVLLAVLVLTDTPTDDDWTKVVYLLTGMETIAFAAIAFLFGREVVRTQAVAADAVTKSARARSAQSAQLAAKSKIEERRAKEAADRLAEEKRQADEAGAHAAKQVEEVVRRLREQGEPRYQPIFRELGEDERTILNLDFADDEAVYLATAPPVGSSATRATDVLDELLRLQGYLEGRFGKTQSHE